MTLMTILLPTEQPELPCSVQVLCGSCFGQVALRKRSVQVALRKCCRSFREVLRILGFYYICT